MTFASIEQPRATTHALAATLTLTLTFILAFACSEPPPPPPVAVEPPALNPKPTPIPPTRPLEATSEPATPPEPAPLAYRSPGPDDVARIRGYLAAPLAQRAGIAARLDETIGAAGVIEALPVIQRPPSAPLRPGIHTLRTEVNGEPTEYKVAVPRGYRDETPWPLHINLHGGGAWSSATTCMRQWQRPKRKPFIIVCPTTTQGRWWTVIGDATIRAVLEDVVGRVNVDRDRVTIGGMSNGGTGTWHMAIKYPWLFAAAVPRCGAQIPNHAYNANMTHLPILLIHGDDDKQIDIEHSQAQQASLRRAGNDARLITVEGGGHRFFNDKNDEVARFLAAARRAVPDRVTYTPIPGHLNTRPYYVRGSIEAPITLSHSREGDVHTITLETSEALPLRVYVPGADPRRALTLEVVLISRVGAEPVSLFDGTVRPRADVALETFAETRDAGRVYAHAVDVELP